MKIICSLLFLVFLSNVATAQQRQPEYWLFIHSNNCSYIATVNDMPAHTNFNEGSQTSLSLPVNSLLLQSGVHTLHLTLLPKLEADFNPDSVLPKIYSVKIKIVRSENKKDSTVLEREYVAAPGTNLSSAEHLEQFNAELPYQLMGWENGADLTREDQKALETEVVKYYNDMMKDYETKNLNTIQKKYSKRQSELAESLYLDPVENEKKWKAALKNDLGKEQSFKLEHYKVQFYGNGKVVALVRTDGEFRGKSAFLGLTDDNYYYMYNLLLYRPKAGEPLQVIR